MELKKKYVPVTVHFDANGKMRPIEIEFDEIADIISTRYWTCAAQPAKV